ncbi:MAG: T9SS type A sorting domain-containing protein [Bacteroidetes bacterium]|nr:T9SS type A sorting domain-containing protein [Bacteroidota bacterium]
MKHRVLLLAGLLPLLPSLRAQNALVYDPTVPVTRNGVPLAMAWAGGLNFPQVSDIDLDGDGDKDLFLFDRTGNKVITLLNQGVAGQTSYVFTRAYDHVQPFPILQEWALLRDYNCDGKEDIFTYTSAGFGVYKNTSDANGLSFQLVDDLVGSNYVPTESPNLYISQVDIPGIEDIDGDGDLDVVTFSIFGNYVEYHKNLSMELYGTCDSLRYMVRNRCWGYFSENLNNNSVTLHNPCMFNVTDPELPVQVEHRRHLLQAALDGGDALAEEARAAHVGSTLTPIDLDGDGDKDLLLGDVLYDNLTALINGGTVDSAYMVSQDTLFPLYDTPVHLDIFPAAFYEDVDNDGKRDLIVAPNYPSLSENAHGILYYTNTGTDAAPVFHFRQNDLFQDRMLEFGDGAYPVPFDYNGDGRMDLIVANYGYYAHGGTYPCKLAVLKNTGTATAPAFDLVDSDYMGLSTSGIGNAMYPAFGDLDGDGDKDLYIGDLQGQLHYYENTATGPVAQFVLTEPTVNNDAGQPIDVGQHATPQFWDLNEDGLLDLLIGERNGNINYYRNTGTVNAPVWHLDNDSVGGVTVNEWWNVTGYSVPFMHRTEDGTLELLVGSESGWIHQFGDIEGNLNGTWELIDSTWQDLYEGIRTGLALYDFTGDGHEDAVIGNYRGGLSFWRNDTPSGVTGATRTATEAFALLPNPANGGTDVVLDVPVGRTTRLDVLNDLGQVLHTMPLRDKRSRLATDGFRNGVYLVRVTDGTTRWTQRLVVMH